MIPQIIFFILISVELILYFVNDGKKRISHFKDAILSAIILTIVIIWGNFFSVFGIPQVIYIVLVVFEIVISAISNKRTEIVDFKSAFVAIIIRILLLWWGGFFSVFFE